ncbi:MAG: OmpA family protein [Actinomycetota bacterium]
MRSQRKLTGLSWLAVPVLIVLLVSAALLGNWLSDKARTEAIEASGLRSEQVEADGLDITLTGLSDAAERDAAVAAVDELDSTWDVTGVLAAGQRDAEQSEADDGGTGDGVEDADEADPDDDVSDDANDDAADDEASADTNDDGDSAGSSGTDDAGDTDEAGALPTLDVGFDPDGTVTLAGSVLNDADKDALLSAAASQFGGDQVRDELDVLADGEGPVRVVLGGSAVSEAQADAWRTAGAEITAGLAGEITDDIEVVAGTVDQSLNALVDLDPIEFDERRAAVRASSFATLDAAATLINDNPDAGVFRVVGHTDSDGPAGGNERLSLARAEAVVAYLVAEGGVDPDRLDAVGAGETELLIEPELTLADKQRNRRIEWELVS